jgi:hypothetical protein
MYCLIVFREAFSCASTCTISELISGNGRSLALPIAGCGLAAWSDWDVGAV